MALKELCLFGNHELLRNEGGKMPNGIGKKNYGVVGIGCIGIVARIVDGTRKGF